MTISKPYDIDIFQNAKNVYNFINNMSNTNIISKDRFDINLSTFVEI